MMKSSGSITILRILKIAPTTYTILIRSYQVCRKTDSGRKSTAGIQRFFMRTRTIYDLLCAKENSPYVERCEYNRGLPVRKDYSPPIPFISTKLLIPKNNQTQLD